MWIVALYALAMATLGFVHKPVATGFAETPAFDLAAYALPDGTLPDLCLTEHGQSHDSGISSHCDACALSHAPGLVPPTQLGLPVVTATRLAIAAEPDGQFSPAPRRGPSSRGPPLT